MKTFFSDKNINNKMSGGKFALKHSLEYNTTNILQEFVNSGVADQILDNAYDNNGSIELGSIGPTGPLVLMVLL